MVRLNHPTKSPCSILHAMCVPVMAVFVLLLLIPIAAGAKAKPYRIGIVLPGDQWISGVKA